MMDYEKIKVDGGTIFRGDCLDVMRQMPENSVSACIVDPPYGLTQKEPDITQVLSDWISGKETSHTEGAGGFMGAKWDNFVPGPHIWKEVYRVLIPGSYCLVFAATRNFDLTAIALRLAGFQFRDTIASFYPHEPSIICWNYSCLSEDTEILTQDGWVSFSRGVIDMPVLCYDPGENTYAFHKPIRVFQYQNQHTAYRIISDNTDQIVSRGHRCLVEREGRLVFITAENLSSEEKIPFLESMSDLSKYFYNNEYERVTSRDMYKGVQETIPIKEKERTSCSSTNGKEEDGRGNMCCLRKSLLEAEGLGQESETADVFSEMQRKSQGPRTKEAWIQGTRGLDREVDGILFKEDEWSEQSRMEGGSNLFQEKRKLPPKSNSICKMSRGILGDGEEGWVCNGTPSCCSEITGESSKEFRSSSSRESRSIRQSTRESDAIHEQWSSQTIRVKGLPRTTVARVEPIEYNGRIWCIESPTGAFVARRNGKIFLTGNSGFPKSFSIDKGIDKKLGEEREIIGPRLRPDTGKPHQFGVGFTKGIGADTVRKECNVTAPSSEAAKRFSGYGTSLKPSFEPILVCMKPVEKNYVHNALKYGQAGMNIDACRVGSGNYVRETDIGLGQGFDAPNKTYGQGMGGVISPPHPSGRWPANCLFTHHPGCRHQGTKRVKGSGTSKTFHEGYDGESTTKFLRGVSHPGNQHADPDGKETVEDWACSKECPANILNIQSGVVSFGSKEGGYTYDEKEYEVEGFVKTCKPNAPSNYGDKGGASRFFAQFQIESENKDLLESLKSCAETCPVRILDQLSGVLTSGRMEPHHKRNVPRMGHGGVYGDDAGDPDSAFKGKSSGGDSGGASRFFAQFEAEGETEASRIFYCSKASKKEKRPYNTHCTVKPLKLLEYLIKLVMPPKNGLVLDPFCGSGTTLVACKNLGVPFIGIELCEEYVEICRKRIEGE